MAVLYSSIVSEIVASEIANLIAACRIPLWLAGDWLAYSSDVWFRRRNDFIFIFIFSPLFSIEWQANFDWILSPTGSAKSLPEKVSVTLMFPFLSLLSPSSHVNAQNGDYNNKESQNVLNTLATKLLAFFLNFYFGERWKEKRSNKPVMDRCICSWIIWRTEQGGRLRYRAESRHE